MRTIPGLNDVHGRIVGTYSLIDPLNLVNGGHGFELVKGVFKTIDYPGASATAPSALNAVGETVGVYFDSAGGYHGFLFNNGTFSAINYPGATDTQALGINKPGEIVGFYVTSDRCRQLQ